jgi:hypothetical protein
MIDSSSGAISCEHCQQCIDRESDLIMFPGTPRMRHFHRRCFGEWLAKDHKIYPGRRNSYTSSKDIKKTINFLRIFGLLIPIFIAALTIILYFGIPPYPDFPSDILNLAVLLGIGLLVSGGLGFFLLFYARRLQRDLDQLNRVFPDS